MGENNYIFLVELVILIYFLYRIQANNPTQDITFFHTRLARSKNQSKKKNRRKSSRKAFFLLLLQRKKVTQLKKILYRELLSETIEEKLLSTLYVEFYLSTSGEEMNNFLHIGVVQILKEKLLNY